MSSASTTSGAWQKVDTKGTIIAARASEGRYQITLNKGDRVLVHANKDGWSLVEQIEIPTTEGQHNPLGLYPDVFIKLDGKENAHVNHFQRKLPTFQQAMEYSESPLAREILQVIREWSSELTKLRNENLMEEYEAIKRQMGILVGLRKQITDLKFQQTADENQKEEINQKVIKVIEEGSRKLNLDLIVRVNEGSLKGQRANEVNTSVIDLYRQYADVQEKEDYSKRKRKIREELRNLQSNEEVKEKEKLENDLMLKIDPDFKVNDTIQRIRSKFELPYGNIHLLLNVEACMFTFGEDAEIYFSIYNYPERRYITEEYMLTVTPQGMPKDIRLIQNSKTLFTDIKEEQYLQELYLVVKIYRKGKMLFDIKSNTKNTSSRIVMNSQQQLNPFETEDVEDESNVRRPFGCTLLPISPQVINEHLLNEMEFQPGTLVLYTTAKEELFHRLPDFIIEGQGPIERLPQDKAIGIGISVKLFNKPVTKVLEENNLTLTDHVCITKCLELPTVTHPTIQRNDLYLTIIKGKFLEVRNVKINGKVYNTKTKNTLACIDRNTCLHKKPYVNYNSAVVYHAPTPTWNETICVSVSPTEIYDSVLVLTFANATAKKKTSTEKFGISICDFKDDLGMITKGEDPETGILHLPIYKYVKDMEKNIFDFISTPSKLQATKDIAVVKIKLVSNLVSQDVSLDNFIRWETKQYPIRLVLENFDKLPLSSISNHIKVVLDTLFDILLKKNDEETAKSVFHSILTIGGKITSPDLEEHCKMFYSYCEECFSNTDPSIHKWFLDNLLVNLNINLEQDLASDTENNQLNTIKNTLLGFPFIFRIILKNRLNYELENKSDGMSSTEYLKLIKMVIEKLSKIMSITTHQSIHEAQDSIIKLMINLFFNFNDFFPTSISRKELAMIVKDFVESIPNTGRLSTVEGKLGIIRVLCSSTLLKHADARNIIIDLILNQIENQKAISNSFSRRVCSEILADLLATIQRGLIQRVESYSSVKKDLTQVLYKLPFIGQLFNELSKEKSETEQKINRFGKRDDLESFQEQRELERIQQTRCVLFSVILCIFYLTDFDMITQYFQRTLTTEEAMYKDQLKDKLVQEMMEELQQNTIKKKVMLPSEAELVGLTQSKRISDIFELIESMIEDPPIPEYWIAFNVFTYHTIMKTIQTFSEYLQKHHVKKFDPKLWNRLFNVYYRFSLAPRLQTEKFSLSKQAKFNIHGDLRVDCVALFRKVFEGLSVDNQYFFVPDMVDRVLRLAASIPKQEIYVHTLNIYFNILKLEFESEKSLQHTQGLTAAVFDEFIVNDRLTDDKFKDFFVEVLSERFEKDVALKTEGQHFMNQTKLFMELVASVKKFTDDQEDQKTNALLRVMDYVGKTHQEEIYFKYIHKLAKVHENIKNYVEAGMSLMKHAEKLSFMYDTMLPQLSEEYIAEPEYRRKERLYHQAIKYFDLGKDWERAIKLSRDLVPIYENKTYEYKKLADLLRLQGELFQKIADQKRFYSSYYFVGYYGKGFEPYGLKNKEYIYRGAEAERLVDFTDRVTKRFPNAEMLKPLEEAPEEKKEAEGQYIRVITVYPSSYKEIENKCVNIQRNMTVSKNISGYDACNDITVFKLGKTFRGHPEDKKMNEFRDLFTEFTFYIIEPRTNDKLSQEITSEIELTGVTFPTMIRRKPILQKKKAVLEPIDNAVKNIEDKNIDLNELVLNHLLDTKPDTKQLSMSLNGTIDAAVHGGITKYIEAFFVADWIQQHPQQLSSVKKLQKALEAQLDVLGKGLEMYRKFGSAQTKAHVDHLTVMHNNMSEQLSSIINFDYGFYLTEEYKKQQKELEKGEKN
ncbi:hypothetical protein ABK040_000094 [Willaertia magna]